VLPATFDALCQCLGNDKFFFKRSLNDGLVYQKVP